MARSKRKKPVKYYSANRRKVYARGDDIDPFVLFSLFNWECFLCREPIDRRRRCPDWKAATIEHLTPLAVGGTHTWDNVVPAHYKCNMDKGELVFDPSTDRLLM